MNYPYTFYDDSSVLLSDVTIGSLPETTVFNNQKLYVKDEFHITLLSAQYLSEIIDAANQKAIKRQILQEFERFIETTPLELYKILNEIRFAQTQDQKTIIVMAEVPDLDKLFERLSQKFSIELPKQQPHVTLYRLPKDFIGIPIPSPEILEAISKPVEIPGLGSLIFKK